MHVHFCVMHPVNIQEGLLMSEQEKCFFRQLCLVFVSKLMEQECAT